MPVVYNIHPDRDELSKLRSILQGRDFMVREFHDGKEAEKELGKLPPNAVLMQIGIKASDDRPFIEILNEQIPDCPIILLAEKHQVMEAAKMLGENSIFDYFLMNPIVDPIRLHVMLDKALTQSIIQVNLESLKRRLQALPDNLPSAFDEQADSLKNEIGERLENFQKRMKSREFEDVVKLIDEKRFDSEFERFKKEEIDSSIDKNRQQLSENLVTRLRNFSYNISQQIDNPPTIEKLAEFRRQLVGDDLRDSLGETPLKGSSKTELLQGQKKKILLLAEDDQSTRGLTSIIENGGFSVVLAHSPKRLLEIIRNNEKIDMLICGYDLGNITGLDIVKEVRNKTGKANFPTIIVTSNPPRDLGKSSKEAGADEFLILPILPVILIEKINSYLKAS